MAEKRTAKMEAMEQLHAAVAEALTQGLEPTERVIPAKLDNDGEEIEPERREVVGPSPAMLAVAAKFLKDNSIFATGEQSGAVGELRDKIKQRATSRKPSAQDANDALRAIGQNLLQ